LRDQRIRKNVVQEVCTTEDAYRTALTTTVDLFLRPLQKKKFIKPDEITTLFGTVEQLLNVHRELQKALSEEMSRDDMTHPRIGAVISKMSPFLKIYTEYVNNFDNSNEMNDQLLLKNKKYVSFLEVRIFEKINF
jgi:hypothetical protein